jgi:predicted DNA-binding WGR domain protein
VSYREFRQQGRANNRVWYVEVDGDTVNTKHGMFGGALTPTSDTKKPVNVGKSNEKSPEVVAQEHAERQILQKRRKGYVEYIDGNAIESTDRSINWESLPLHLCFWKPTNSMRKGLTNKLRDGKAWAPRKRDGMAYPILHDELSVIQMYSRVMLPTHKDEPDLSWSERFPHIADEMATVCRIRDIPPRTLFLGEVVANKPGTDIDDFALVESVTKSLTPAALELQRERGRLRYYIWDVAFWDGIPMCAESSLRDRYALIHDLFHSCDYIDPVDVYRPFEIQKLRTKHDTGTVEALCAEAMEREWEGWVIVDPDAIMGDRAWNLRGKTDRPGFAGKLKPVYEEDVVLAWDGVYGTGRHQHGVRNLTMFQYTEAGELVEVGHVGSGLTDQKKAQLTDESLYPLVASIRFENWTPGKKMRIARLLRFREDKAPEECINPNL